MYLGMLKQHCIVSLLEMYY